MTRGRNPGRSVKGPSWALAAMLMLVSPLADGAMAKQATPISPEAFVEKGIDTVISILKDRDTTKRQNFFQLQSAFRRYFAHRRIAGLSGGRPGRV